MGTKSFFLKASVIYCLFGLSSAVVKVLVTGHLAADTNIGASATAHSESSPLWYSLFIASYSLTTLWLISTSIKQILPAILNQKILIILLTYILFSTLWAIDPQKSFVAAIKIIWAVLFGFFMVKRFTSREILELLSITMAIIIIGSFFFAFFLPGYGIDEDGNWCGVFDHKNGLAIRMNLAFVILALTANHVKEYRKQAIVFAGLAVLLIFLSRSGTGAVVLSLIVISQFLMPFIRSHAAMLLSLGLTSLCIFGLLFILADGKAIIDSFFYLIGKDPTLTGRTDIWRGIYYTLTDNNFNRLFFGYGAQHVLLTNGGSIISQDLEGNLALSPNTFYMDVLAKYGLIGSLLYAMTLVQALLIALKQLKFPSSELSSMHIVIVMIIIINGITENMDEMSIMWVFFAIVFASAYHRISNQPKLSLAYN